MIFPRWMRWIRIGALIAARPAARKILRNAIRLQLIVKRENVKRDSGEEAFGTPLPFCGRDDIYLSNGLLRDRNAWTRHARITRRSGCTGSCCDAGRSCSGSASTRTACNDLRKMGVDSHRAGL